MVEFGSTPSGSMTPDEFELLAQQTNNFAVDDDGCSIQDDGLVECNPPSFIKGKIKEKLAQIKENEIIDLTDITTPGYVVPQNLLIPKKTRNTKIYEEMVEELKEINPYLDENEKYIENQPKADLTPESINSNKISDDGDDIDISAYILSDTESKNKQTLWESINKDWEEKQKEKRQLEESGQIQPKKKRKKYVYIIYIIDTSC